MISSRSHPIIPKDYRVFVAGNKVSENEQSDGSDGSDGWTGLRSKPELADQRSAPLGSVGISAG
jgi:hypothetical protein